MNDIGRFTPGGRAPLMAMVELTRRCDMRCPVCFADAGPDLPESDDPSLKEVEDRLRRLLAVTGGPIPLQLSGGEPSLRRDLPQVVAMARGLGFTHVELVTNGRRAARDADFLPRLKDAGLAAVYLQYDTMDPEALGAIRGPGDHGAVRRQALAATRRADLCATLAVAVVPGVNDHLLGQVVEDALEQLDTVRAINFQAASPFAGRFPDEDARPLSMTELLDRIAEQTGVGAASFLRLPGNHPDCNAIAFVARADGRLRPLLNELDEAAVGRFLGPEPRHTIHELFLGKARFLRRHLTRPGGLSSLLALGWKARDLMSTKHLTLFAKGFMCESTLDEERLGGCCYALAGPHGPVSFCAYNCRHRFADQAAATQASPEEAPCPIS